MTTASDTLHELFVTGLVNQHAVEKQALAIMTPQLSRIEHYPEVADRLRLHIDETNHQIARLDELLSAAGTSGSVLKDTALGFSGSMAALMHTPAGDEILKNSFANYAFEHFEMAGYISLLALAEGAGSTQAMPLLTQSLKEEESMAQWIGDALPRITRQYAALYAGGGSAAAKV